MSYKPTAQQTAFDALASKASAHAKKYFVDDHLNQMYHVNPQIKEPMFNRGTWFRVTFINRICDYFVRYYPSGQIIVFGGGLDTLYHRVSPPAYFRFFEIDLPEIVQQKAQKLHLQHISPTSYGADNYKIYYGDLEDPNVLSGFDHESPTLFVSDVVISYLDTDATIELFRQMQRFRSFGFVAFEMVNPHDKFGDQMIYNMSLRETFMPTFAEIGYCSNYAARLQDAGCTATFCKEAWGVYMGFRGRREIEALELLDEIEQFQLIMNHYAVLVAGKSVECCEWLENELVE